MHFFLLLLLVVAVFGAAFALPPPSVLDLPLYRDQYVTAFVGAEGREVVMRVRFDSSEIVLYESTALSRASSSSYDARCSTELLSLGAGRTFRWRVRYSYQGDPTVRDPPETDDRTQHQGSLGMAAGSPVWSDFDSWTRAPTRLALGWVAPHAAELIADGDATLDLAHDWTLVAWQLHAEWLNATEAPTVRLSDAASARVPIGELRHGRYPTARIWSDSTAAGGAPSVLVGFEHAKSLVVARRIADERTFVAASHVPAPVERIDFQWLFLGAFSMLWIYYPAMLELHLAATYWRWAATPAAAPPPPQDWSIVSQATLWVALLSVFAAQSSLMSWRSMQDMHEPYGDASATLAVVVFYALIACVIAAVALADPANATDANVTARYVALCSLAWLALVPRFDEGIHIVLMVLLSAVAFVRLSDLVLRLRRAQGGRLGTAGIAYATLALAFGWFFSFYTLAEYADQRWPQHPSLFFVCALGLGLCWAVGSFEPFVRQHVVRFRHRLRKLAGDPDVKAAQPVRALPLRAAAVPVVLAADGTLSSFTGLPAAY